MKCGNCKADHQTAAMVQMCYRRAGKITGRPNGRGRGSVDRHNRRYDAAHAELLHLASKIDPGGYAIRNSDVARNDISFYVVQRPERGQHTNQTLVWRRASDERIPLGVKESVRVLRIIAADPQAASLLFGANLGVCGVCGRSLTTKESRDRGIGPKCAEKRGWG